LLLRLFHSSPPAQGYHTRKCPLFPDSFPSENNHATLSFIYRNRDSRPHSPSSYHLQFSASL
jgi:hypothetical protein